jgi:putative sterol carrier protein
LAHGTEVSENIVVFDGFLGLILTKQLSLENILERSRCMAETVKEILDTMPQRFNPDAAAGLDAVFQFDISGEEAGQWHLIVKDQQCQIVEGSHASPNVTFSMATNDFTDMMTGKLGGQAAFFSGKLRVSGDLMLAQRLESLFRRG